MKFSENTLYASVIDAQEFNYAHFNKQVAGLKYNALSFRIKSDATLGFSGKSISAGDKSVTFFPKGLEYTRSCTHDRMLVIHFEGGGILSDEIECVYPKNESIPQLFDEIVSTFSKKESGYNYRAGALFYELLYQLKKEFESHAKYPALLERALEIISVRYCDPQLTVSGIAKELSVSEVYLRRLFADVIEKSPKQYLSSLRLEKAKSLLKHSDSPIESIATACGFSDSKNFAVAFKKSEGLSSTDYRKKYSSYI